MIRVDLDRLAALVPQAREPYLRSLGSLPAVLACFGILSSRTRVRHFLAQTLHESAGFRRVEEDLNYTTPARLMTVWPTRFVSELSTRPFLRNPEALAEKVYGGRVKDLGNTEPGDGWLFRGRGAIQITGRANYHQIGRFLDVDLVADPELAGHETYLFPVAGAIWKFRSGNALADTDDLRAVTRAINGGYTGLVDRRRWFEVLGPVIEEAS